jgi:hypothetical protein
MPKFSKISFLDARAFIDSRLFPVFVEIEARINSDVLFGSSYFGSTM